MAAAGLATALAMATDSLGQTLNWNNALGGAASTSGNWSPVAVPGAANDLVYNIVANYSVTFNAATIASRTQTFKKGTIALTMSSPHTTSSGVTIGSALGDNPVVTLLSGTWNSTFNSSTGFDIGDVPGASGTLNVNNNGDVIVGSTLEVGNDPQGGTGTLNINSGALVSATSVIDGTFGTINHNGGTLKINGGTYTGHADPLVVTGTGSPTLQLSNNLSKAIAPAGAVAIIVGDDTGAGAFTGNLLIDSGADLILSGPSKDIIIGDDSGTTGAIVVSGVGSRLVANQPGDDIFVGRNGTGTLTIENGGQLLATSIQVPASSLNGNGTMFMNGSVAQTVTTANLAVGNAPGLGNGNVIMNKGTMNVTNPGVGIVIRESGSLNVNATADLNVSGTVLVDRGSLSLGGTLIATILVDIDGGSLNSVAGPVDPTVTAPVHVRTGGVVEVIAGDLTMGKADLVDALIFDPGSTIRVGAGRTLTLLNSAAGEGIDADGMIDLQGGTTVSDSALDTQGSGVNTVTGFGTFNASVRTRPFQTYTPTGTGLVFNRLLVLNSAFQANGTAVRLGPASRLAELGGSHVFNCKFTADAGSEMSANLGNAAAFGPITMGDGTTTGVTLNGIIHLGTNGTLTLNDRNGVALGTLTDMNGGLITCNNGLTVTPGRVLRGHGSIDVPNLGANGFTVSGGTIDPDGYFAQTDTYRGIGQFAVSGRYTQQATGTYLCEVAGFDNAFGPLNDRINVVGPAFINGTLDVSLIDGYSATLCDTFTIFTGTSVTGTFSNVIAPPNVRVVYNPTSVQLIVAGCTADFNQDCSVDPDDLADYIGCFFAQPPCDGADINNDDTVNPDDLADFIGVFFAGCG